MSDLEMAITLLIKTFSKYAGKEGDKHALNRAELKELLQNELAGLLGVSDLSFSSSKRYSTEICTGKKNIVCSLTACLQTLFLQKANDKGAMDKIFKDLDSNRDNSVDFKEFGCFVFTLTMMCHEFFCEK